MPQIAVQCCHMRGEKSMLAAFAMISSLQRFKLFVVVLCVSVWRTVRARQTLKKQQMSLRHMNTKLRHIEIADCVNVFSI